MTFGEAAQRLLTESGFSFRDLESKSGISKSTLSRIIRNVDDRGGNYRNISLKRIFQLAIAFKLSSEQTDVLINLAHPEFQLLHTAIKNKMNIIEASTYLDDFGFDVLIND